jgi:hypothetical protein
MTLVVSTATRSLITISIDSAVTFTSSVRGTRYEVEDKYRKIDGVGAVAAWGERTGLRLNTFLREKGVKPETHTINDLIELVEFYFRNEYKPHERGGGSVGFHVGGFDKNNRARLVHIYFDMIEGASEMDYGFSDHSPDEEHPLQLVYNGWHELAGRVVDNLIRQAQRGRDVRFDITSPCGRIRFSEYLLHVTAGITREVGLPFYTLCVSPKISKIEQLRNEDGSIPSQSYVEAIIRLIGVEDEELDPLFVEEEESSLSFTSLNPSSVDLSPDPLQGRWQTDYECRGGTATIAYRRYHRGLFG